VPDDDAALSGHPGAEPLLLSVGEPARERLARAGEIGETAAGQVRPGAGVGV